MQLLRDLGIWLSSRIDKKASHRQLMSMGRIATVAGILLSVFGAYIAKSMPMVIDYLQAISSMFLAPTVAVILLGMFFKRITPKGGFWGLLIGTACPVGLFLAQEASLITYNTIIPAFSETSEKAFMAANFWRAFWAWLIAAGTTVLVSLFTEKKSDEELKGYVNGLTERVKTADDDLPAYKKPVFWAGVTLVIFIIINVYFW